MKRSAGRRRSQASPRPPAGANPQSRKETMIVALLLVRRLIAPLLLTLVLIGGSVTTAVAAELRQGDQVVIPANETIDDDLYARRPVRDHQRERDRRRAGRRQHADNCRTCGWRCRWPPAARSACPDAIDGSLRTMSGTVDLAGSIGNDVVFLGNTLRFGPDAQVGRDVLIGRE